MEHVLIAGGCSSGAFLMSLGIAKKKEKQDGALQKRAACLCMEMLRRQTDRQTDLWI